MMKTLPISFNFKKITAFALIGTSVLAIAAPMDFNEQRSGCKHQDQKQERAFMPPHGLPPFLLGIKLTEEQNDKIFALTYPEIPKKHDRMKQRMQLIKSIHALSSSEKFDENQAKVIAEKLAKIDQDDLINKATIDNKIFQILTPEQRTQLIKNQAQQAEGKMMMPMHFGPMHD